MQVLYSMKGEENMEIVNAESYPLLGYMKGRCPSCGEWEAPITKEELDGMVDIYAHHGTSLRELEGNDFYRREVWKEYFRCPKCKCQFSVKFSST